MGLMGLNPSRSCSSMEVKRHHLFGHGWAAKQAITAVFAAPRQTENQKWKGFLQEPGITFLPVPRAKDERAEAFRRDRNCDAAFTPRGVRPIAPVTWDLGMQVL